MAFLVLEWDDADVEDLEGNLLTGQPPRRVIVVPGKLVNLVP
jgi:hypothetical protein